MPQDQSNTPSSSTLRIFDSNETNTITFNNHLVTESLGPAAVRSGATRQGPWIESARSNGQRSESAWLEANKHMLTEYANKWIAVSKGRVVTSNDEFTEVRAFLDREQIANALITYLDDVGERRLFID